MRSVTIDVAAMEARRQDRQLMVQRPLLRATIAEQVLHRQICRLETERRGTAECDGLDEDAWG